MKRQSKTAVLANLTLGLIGIADQQSEPIQKMMLTPPPLGQPIKTDPALTSLSLTTDSGKNEAQIDINPTEMQILKEVKFLYAGVRDLEDSIHASLERVLKSKEELFLAKMKLGRCLVSAKGVIPHGAFQKLRTAMGIPLADRTMRDAQRQFRTLCGFSEQSQAGKGLKNGTETTQKWSNEVLANALSGCKSLREYAHKIGGKEGEIILRALRGNKTLPYQIATAQMMLRAIEQYDSAKKIDEDLLQSLRPRVVSMIAPKKELTRKNS